MSLAYKKFADAHAASLFLAERPEARLLGGGTFLIRRVNEGDTAIATLVRVTDPELTRIEAAGDAIRIGAGATMSAVAREPGLSFLAPAARSVGGPAVRAAATVGGNLFAPVPYGDFGVALLALDATVSVQGPDGVEELAVDDFFRARDRFATGHIVRSIGLTRPPDGAFRFLKISRVKPKGAAVLTIGATLTVSAQGAVSAARIALGAMAATPVRARRMEQALIGRPLTPDAVADAAALASEEVSPVSDAIASDWYRRAVLPVHLQRVLLG